MTLEKAIQWANSRPRSGGYQYHVVPFNDGYCVVSDSHRKRHPNMKVVYSTEGEFNSK